MVPKTIFHSGIKINKCNLFAFNLHMQHIKMNLDFFFFFKFVEKKKEEKDTFKGCQRNFHMSSIYGVECAKEMQTYI